MSVTELEELYVKMTQHFLFNVYEISDDIDVHVTFETMNNRGKRLSYLELLKNRLIYLSIMFDADESIRSRLRRDINDCWKKIYHLLGQNKNRQLLDDEFLSAHFQLYFCKEYNEIREKYFNYRYVSQRVAPYEYLLEHYFIPQNISNKSLLSENVFAYIESLKNNITYWNIINNPEYSGYSEEIQEYLRKINYLLQNRGHYGIIEVSPVKVLLLAYIECNKTTTNLIKFLKSLEKYLFLIRFIPYEIIDKNQIKLIEFPEIINRLNSGELSPVGVKEKVDKAIVNLTTSTEINSMLVTYYNRNGFYGEDFLRYFLCEYEVSLMKVSKSKIEKLSRDIVFSSSYNSIEHIYPQNAHKKYWTNMFQGYTDKQKKLLRNSLGNFVIVSKEKNSKLANLSFREKKCNTQNTFGYKYGTFAELELTNYEDWGAKEILARGIKFVNFLTQRWGISIGTGNQEDKIKFLGLDFIKDNK